MTVRFGELKALTSLPIKEIHDQFRYEEVLTVLPVLDDAASREALLVATRPMLALLIPVRVPPRHWMTRWAAWETVSMSDPGATPGQPDDVYRLDVLVGRQTFHARLRGERGRKAMRDFVMAVRLSQPRSSATRSRAPER
jgi:hypothetical protein